MSRFFDRRLLRAARPQRAFLALAVLAGALAGILTVLQAGALSRAVTRAFLGGFELAGIRPLLWALAGFSLARGLAAWLGELAAGRVAQRVKDELRERLVRHLVALGPLRLRSSGGAEGDAGARTGELLNTALDGVEALDAYFSQYLPQLALAAVVPVAFLLVVFPIDPLSGLVLLLTAPLIPVFMVLIGSLTDALTRRQWATLSRLAAHFLDVLQGLTTLKLFGRSREQIVLIRRISEQHRDATLEVLRVAFLSAFVLEIVGTISTAIVAVEIGLRLLAGRLAFEPAFFVLILAPEFYLPLRQLGLRFHAGVSGVAAAHRIFDVLDLPLPPAAPAAGAGAPRVPHVTLTGVTVVYPDRAVPALDRVTFDIAPGERVALVGATGAGKSTVAALLLRFVEPAGGQILVDGRDMAELPADEWRGRIAYVPQAPYLLNVPVADNIRLGRPDARPDQVVAAAVAARADEFIRRLPQGYDTLVGERGSRLSGGQAQRIALARAFLADAPLVILDEATANLDPDTDAEVQASLADLLAGRSSLIIAHRLATVQNADKILVLDAGQVVERGTHAELLAACGRYRQMVAGCGEGRSAAQVTALGAQGRASGDAVPPAMPDRPSGDAIPPATPDRPSGDAIPSAAPDRPEIHLRATEERYVNGANERAAEPSAPFMGRRSVARRFISGRVGPRRASLDDGARNPLAGLLPFLAPYASWVALSVLLGFLTIGSSIGLLSVSAWIVASAALQPSIAVLQVAVVGVRFFGIARGVFRYLERLASHQVTFRVLSAMRVWFYAAIEPFAPARLGRYQSGDLLARVVSDVGVLENFYVRAVSPPLVAALIAILTAVILAAFDPSLVLPVLALQVVAGIAVPVLTQQLGRRPGRALTEDRGRLNQSLVDLLQGLPDLLAFRAAPQQVARVAGEGAALSAAARRMSAISAAANAGGTVLSWLAAAAVLAVATPLVRAGRLEGVSLAVLTLLTIASFEGVLPLPLAGQYLSASASAARRLFDVAGKSPNRADVAAAMHFQPPAPVQPAVLASAPPPAVAFSRVSLRYGPQEPLALDRVSLAIPPGGLLTVVGASGAGKSTLANALLRFWDYEAGTIRLGERDLRTLPEEEARRAVGVVSQQTHLFNATIRTNLLLARPDATTAQIEAASRAAQLHEFVAGLPDGYDTRIGEGGARLSGGERQRVAIARALLKDAPVLILDEPAASLDAGTEAELWNALQPLLERRTTLLITHRLGGPAARGQIVVMDRGRIVELGDHAGLLGAGGLYARLWDQQQAAISCPDA